ncbi:hypothetical protein GGR50DRAFT_690511 [Xylaria sp. CBS 124048]|nr:hypothetical protein GGR50DRAFT_690511 [Xylaria sp. CBS 124048]
MAGPPRTAPVTASASGPVINSSSDLSDFSGPSYSTRDTSPNSDLISILTTRSRPSSSHIDLSVVDDTERAPDTLLDNDDGDNDSDSDARQDGGGAVDHNDKIYGVMDNHAFQSVNDRRSKLMSDRAPMNHTQHGHQAVQPSQVARSGTQAPGNHRGLTSANWRAHQGDESTLPQSRIPYNNPFDPPAAHHLTYPFVRTTPYAGSIMDQHQHQHQQLQLANVTPYPTFGPISEAQLDESYAYCYDRGNGQYTRLIPADMLPPLQNIPALQQSCVGMVVVPLPGGLPSSGHSSNTEPVVLRIHHQQGSPKTPISPADTIQSRIDNIVAATPSTPTRATSSGHHGAGAGSSGGGPPGQRRPKIYCDKWVHEGVCAFTQQGCKYKHEMPSDKVTQHQLGLFHGYPQWWKKHQSDLARQRDVPVTVDGPNNGGASNESRSSNERYPGRAHAMVGGGGGGGRGGGDLSLTSDGGGQLAWQRPSDSQPLGPPPSVIGRVSATRGMSAAMRNSLAAGQPGTNLSPCPASYGSPFGPIAPPARNHGMVMLSTENMHGQPATATQASMESHRTSQQHTRGNSSTGSGMANALAMPSSNPYASLSILDDDEDGEGSTNEIDDYVPPVGSGGARL